MSHAKEFEYIKSDPTGDKISFCQEAQLLAMDASSGNAWNAKRSRRAQQCYHGGVKRVLSNL